MDLQVEAALAAAVIAAVAALVVPYLSAWINRRDSRKAEAAGRLADYLASTHNAMIIVSRFALQPVGAALDHDERHRYYASQDRVNNALNAIILLDPRSVVAAAVVLDRCLVELDRGALLRQWKEGEWTQRRNTVMASSLDDLVEAGRRAYSHGVIDRRRMVQAADAAVQDRSPLPPNHP